MVVSVVISVILVFVEQQRLSSWLLCRKVEVLVRLVPIRLDLQPLELG